MQRWIGLGVVAMVLILGGGAFGYWTIKQNRPAPMWIPMTMKEDLPYEQRKEIAKDLKEKLGRKEILIKVSKDLSLAKEWGLASDDAAADELGRRMFVQVGQTAAAGGSVPSMNVGVNGKLKEIALSGKIATRLMDEVWPILGIKRPDGK